MFDSSSAYCLCIAVCPVCCFKFNGRPHHPAGPGPCQEPGLSENRHGVALLTVVRSKAPGDTGCRPLPRECPRPAPDLFYFVPQLFCAPAGRFLCPSGPLPNRARRAPGQSDPARLLVRLLTQLLTQLLTSTRLVTRLVTRVPAQVPARLLARLPAGPQPEKDDHQCFEALLRSR